MVEAGASQTDVDHFVAALAQGWQREACARLLTDTRATPGLAEHLKWGQPYFSHAGAAVTKWFCANDWVNVYFFRGRELPDPALLFASSNNERMLTVKVTADLDLDRRAFRELVRAAAALAGRTSAAN
ncbi:hypothetical protein BA895_01505 [Humibacillus sp. DSM 29435]|uniref:DUF1801 domain-containing protein n=1 Tax=Humibacillus sp. DSM 29435 TaxID=1869167 RepID=UPI000871BEEF|nr:DUF1801 domain-containing protein [Humibacillus sp. DSM 29435]OFE18873.1 hypothetical protein BA895_01505 [Humibacillus sp. DSM 29435]